MSDMPAMPPPPGGDHNRGPETYGAVIPITILSTAMVLARMYARIRLIRNVGWDDHTIVLAQILNLLTLIFVILSVVNGLGRHMYYLSLQNIVNCGLYFHIVEILYNLNNAVIKVSACLFLLRVLARAATKTFRWFLYAVMATLLVLCVGCSTVILVQCIPVQAGWDPRIKGKCWSYSQALWIGYAQSAWAIATDLLCAGFPIVILKKLQINQRSKYALWFVMSVGFVSALCCIIKLIYLGDLKKGDFTYNGVDVNIWAVLESNIGTIACCIPALRPLFKYLRDRSGTGSLSHRGSRNAPPANIRLSWRDSTTTKSGSLSQPLNGIGANDVPTPIASWRADYRHERKV